MAYVTVPKDLTHVKSKVLFGLTKRQLVCFGGALLTGGPLYFLTRNYLSNSAAALLMIFAMLPGLDVYKRQSPYRTSTGKSAGKENRRSLRKPAAPSLPYGTRQTVISMPICRRA